LSLLGHLDQALKKIEEALALAHRQVHPYSLAVCILQMTPVLDYRCEWSAMQQQVEAAIALCSEHGFGSLLAQATMYRGYALARQGQTAEGFALIRQGLDAQFATGAMLFRPRFLSYLAEAYGIVGRFEEGLASLAEGIATVERTRERLDEAKLHRLKGDLMLLRPGIRVTSRDPSEAEESLRKSIEIARQQGARVYELKAAISLGRLWSTQGRKAEARQVLAETYRWFSEGLDTTDLKEARALLEELS